MFTFRKILVCLFFNENDEHRHGSLLECRWIGYRPCALHSSQLKLVVGGHCCAFVVVVVVERERETSHFFSAAFYLYLPNKFVLRFDCRAVHPPLIVVSIQCFIAQHSLLFGNLSSKASLSQIHNEFPPFSSSIPFKPNIPLGSLRPRMRHRRDHSLFFIYDKMVAINWLKRATGSIKVVTKECRGVVQMDK